MKIKIEIELDEEALNIFEDLPEGFNIVSFDVTKRSFNLAIAGCLVLEITKYGSGIVSVVAAAKKVYDYFRGKKIKSVKINDKEVDPNNQDEIESAIGHA
jgi:hypothetical protein